MICTPPGPSDWRRGKTPMNGIRASQSLIAVIVTFGILTLASISAFAATVVYDVNRTIGAGSVIGSITTDGTFGVIHTTNISDWNLLLDDGAGNTFNLLGPLSGGNSVSFIAGTSFTATATDLSFDFSNTTWDAVLFQNPSVGSGQNFWCLMGTNTSTPLSFACPTSAETLKVPQDGDHLSVIQSGNVSVASSVPEPSTVLLLIPGLVGLAGTAWRTRRRSP